METTFIPVDMFNNKQQKHEKELLESQEQLEFDFDTYGGGVENFATYEKK